LLHNKALVEEYGYAEPAVFSQKVVETISNTHYLHGYSTTIECFHGYLLTDRGLLALSAQIGYSVPLKS